MMYFSRITLNPNASIQALALTLCSNTYKEHQTLWQLFELDPDAKRDFLYRQVIEDSRIKYYVLSDRKPTKSSDIWLIDVPKNYNPQVSTGQSLFFMLRTNPTITVKTEEGKSLRHDIVMHYKIKTKYKSLPQNERPPMQKIIRESSLQWLSSKAEKNGFSFNSEAVIADGYVQHRNHNKGHKALIRYSTIDFQGVLTVTEPELFYKALYFGIGKSKAFGCGLMLIRKI